ncbi:ATP cone domain-containing protein, partial [Cellulomonas hominis]
MTTTELDGAGQPVALTLEEAALTVRKRDGRALPFDPSRIRAAVAKAFVEVHGELGALHELVLDDLVEQVVGELTTRFDGEVKIYEIQNVVEHTLLESHQYDVARVYIDYRVQRDMARSKALDVNHSIGQLVGKDQS